MEPALFSFISKETLKEISTAFESCIHMPIQILDEQGNILEKRGDTTQFCRIFQKFLPENDSCDRLHMRASKQAVSMGETYIFSCHANLNHIVLPLISKNKFLGSVLVGPFVMEKPDSLLIMDIAQRYSLSTENLLELYDESSSLKVFSPTDVTQISRLLYYLFANLIPDSSTESLINRGKLYQQSLISESIQMYKASGEQTTSSYPYEKEKALMTKVKTGNIKEAKGILNDLLGYVLFSEGNSLDTMKSRVMELCSLLSRAAIEGGAATDTILKLNNQFLKSLQSIHSLDTLCYKLQETVEVFMDNMFNYIPNKNSEVMKKAISYISKNYAGPISLQDVASYVHLNPSYFSTIFKQSCGSSFKEYLNMVRIEESKRLLSNTNYSVIDIAIATGFEDQSYFSKVFKKYTGFTPKQYR